jgi:hypothetical protein
MELFICYFIIYWTFALIFYICDKYTNIKRIDDYDKKDVDNLYKKAFFVVIRNQLMINFPSLYFVSYSESYINLFINMAICGVLFSLIHHSLHKYFYNIHKKHHEYSKIVISITSEYNSLFEQFLSWFIGTWSLMYIFPMNKLCSFIYVIFNASYGIIGHSLYPIYFFKNDIKRHLLHHNYFNYNYSGIELYDKIMKTNKSTQNF